MDINVFLLLGRANLLKDCFGHCPSGIWQLEMHYNNRVVDILHMSQKLHPPNFLFIRIVAWTTKF
jgi:hypothetical protein